MAITFGLTAFAWIFFRSENVTSAWLYVTKIFTPKVFAFPVFKDDSLFKPIAFILLAFFVIEWIGREQQYAIAKILNKFTVLRWAFYYILIMLIVVYAGVNQQFIYFQF